MSKKKTWGQQWNYILEQNAGGQDIVADGAWQELFSLAKSVGNCENACTFAMRWGNNNWAARFYHKARQLSKGTFRDCRLLVGLARERGDDLVFYEQIDNMFNNALAGKIKNRCKVVMEMLPKTDSRYLAAKNHLKNLSQI